MKACKEEPSSRSLRPEKLSSAASAFWREGLGEASEPAPHGAPAGDKRAGCGGDGSSRDEWSRNGGRSSELQTRRVARPQDRGPLPESPDRAGAGAHGKPPYRNDRVVPVVITAHPRALPTVLQSAVLGPRSANSISK